MPRRNTLTGRLLRHLLLISVASCVLNVFSRGWDEWDERKLPEPKAEPEPAPEATPAPKRKRRLAGTVSFCVVFFAGLALSAGAGNTVRALIDDGTTTDTTTATDTTLTDTVPLQSVTPVVHATQLQARERPSVAQTAPATLSVKQTTSHRFTQPVKAAQRTTRTRSTLKQASVRRLHPAKSAQGHASKPAKARRHSNAPPLDAEANASGATVWLYRAAVDPTPASARLRVRFARDLVRFSRQAHVDWALTLAMLRADGHNGRSPATRAQLRALTFRLAGLGGATNPWAAALSYSSQTSMADRVVALRNYYRAVGLASLVYGLLSQKHDLEDRVLHDSRVTIYPGGRNDVAAHKVDVRVLATTLYLAETFHQVTVSCLISGHRLYARPGVISAHIYGRAADIAALGGVSIYGHQQPGGVTERAVRALLMLPGGMLPQQVISLLGLGGPSFPLANHYDHIHVGY